MQAIFRVASEFIKFGVVILVVMLGFVVSFLVLFLGAENFGQTWLDLFKAKLGEARLFDNFEKQSRDQMARPYLPCTWLS